VSSWKRTELPGKAQRITGQATLSLTRSLCLLPCPIYSPYSTWHNQKDSNQATVLICSTPPRVPILLRGEVKVLQQLQGPPWLGLPLLLIFSLLSLPSSSLPPCLYDIPPTLQAHTHLRAFVHVSSVFPSSPKAPSLPTWLTPSHHFRFNHTLITP
jgi:hypothetical protein